MHAQKTRGQLSRQRHSFGFTIVELLIVIVVIGILAAIVIVAYNGVQNRARISAVTADLTNTYRKLLAYQIDNAAYPVDLVTAGIQDSGTSFQYSVNNTTSPQTYCVTGTNGGVSYKVSQVSSTPSSGGCAGHGVGGVGAITNLATNPSFEANTTDWSATATTMSRVSSQFHDGAYSLSAVASPGSGNNGVITNGSLIPVVIGTTYYANVWVKGAVAGSNLRVLIHEYNGGVYVGQTSQAFVTTGAWQIVSVNRTIVSGTNIRIGVRMSTDAVTTTYYVDGLIVTSGASNNFADGNSPSWAWNGTTNNSTSTGPAL